VSAFVSFLRKQGVVGLAVGFILGGAVSKLVSALVEDIVNPFLGLILGGSASLSAVVIHVGPAAIQAGHFIGVLVDFAVVAAVVYFVFKGLRLDRLDKKE